MTARRSALRVLVATALVTALAGCSGSGDGSGTTTPSAAHASAPATTCQGPSPSAPGYQAYDCLVSAPSIAGNLFGDPPMVEAAVLVPTGLADSGERRPSVYVLAGFGGSVDYLRDPVVTELTANPESAPDAAKAPVLVFAGGANAPGGSFYTNSPVTGDWADAIAEDLVGYVDATYPTIPEAASRGISGHSMGGSGAINLALHRPDVFGAVYALSPGLFDEKGKEARFAGDEVEGVVAALEEVEPVAVEQRWGELSGLIPGGENAQFAVAYGLAYAGDPSLDTLFRYPFHRDSSGKIVRDDAVWKEWDAGFGDLPGKIERYGDALRGLAHRHRLRAQRRLHLDPARLPLLRRTAARGGHPGHRGPLPGHP